MLSPRTVNFTQSGLYARSHAIYKSCLKWQSFFRVIWWKTLETEAWSLKGPRSNNCLLSKTMSKGYFHTGLVALSPNLSLIAFLLLTLLVCCHTCLLVLGLVSQKQFFDRCLHTCWHPVYKWWSTARDYYLTLKTAAWLLQWAHDLWCVCRTRPWPKCKCFRLLPRSVISAHFDTQKE